MNLETSCPECHGTGVMPAPVSEEYLADPEAGHWAHHCKITCACDVRKLRGMTYLGEPGQVWGGNRHRLALARSHGAVAWVDALITGEVELLWSHGIGTIGSCQALHNGKAGITLRQVSQGDEAAGLLGWSFEPDGHHNWLTSEARK